MKLEKSNLNKILSKGRKITLFGASHIAQKTIRKLDKSSIIAVVDNSENLHGSIFMNHEVKSPNSIPKDSYIIICSTAITPISEQLISLGYNIEKDLTISPSLNDLLIIETCHALGEYLKAFSKSSEVNLVSSPCTNSWILP